MSFFISDKNTVGLIAPSGGAFNTSGAYFWPGLVQEHTLNVELNTTKVRYTGNSTRDVGRFINTVEDYQGTLSYFPQDFRMMLFALGSVADAGSPSPYTHDYIAVNSSDVNNFISGTKNPFVYFGVQESQMSPIANTNFVRTVVGATVDTFNISASEGDFVTCSVDYIAQSSSQDQSGAAVSVTESSVTPYLFQHVLMHIPSGTIPNGLKSVDLTISNNLVARHYGTGSAVVEAMVPTNREYELSLTFDSNTDLVQMYDSYFKGGSTFNALLALANPAVAGSQDCFITMSGCKMANMELPTGIDDINECSMTIFPETLSAIENNLVQYHIIGSAF